jgi:hypothetical protein
MSIHRAADGLDVGFDHAPRPRGIDAQHGGEAVAVLLRDPQRVLPITKFQLTEECRAT